MPFYLCSPLILLPSSSSSSLHLPHASNSSFAPLVFPPFSSLLCLQHCNVKLLCIAGIPRYNIWAPEKGEERGPFPSLMSISPPERGEVVSGRKYTLTQRCESSQSPVRWARCSWIHAAHEWNSRTCTHPNDRGAKSIPALMQVYI